MISNENIGNKFKKFGGENIPDVIEYIKNYITENPYTTIALGCDSINEKKKNRKRNKYVYAFALIFYDNSLKNGAHIIYFREFIPKTQMKSSDRLDKEAELTYIVAEYLEKKLSEFYNRKDLNDYENKRYKYHLAKCNGEFKNVPTFEEEKLINNLILNDEDNSKIFKCIDIHLDYNPFEGSIDADGIPKNKSNKSYKYYTPWLRGIGYRVYVKPLGIAASKASDFLLKNSC